MNAARDRGAVALLGMAVAGIGIAAYLTAVHYADAAPVCAATGSVVDCGAVTRSAWSLVPGTAIPVTVPGMLFFAVSGALAMRALRGRAAPPALHAAWAAAGMAAVLYFVWAELVALHRICEWCTAVHLLVLATFLLALARALPAPGELAAEEALEEAGTAGVPSAGWQD